MIPTVHIKRMIIFDSVSKFFTSDQSIETKVIDNVSFSIEPNTSVALCGASGSGKSTILSLMGGLDKASFGSISVFGHQLDHLNQTQLDNFRLHNVSFVFQFFYLLPTLTILENVLLPAFEKFPSEKSKLKKEALFLMEKVGLEKFINHFPSQLSGGMQSRAGVCRALMLKPRLLLADEPTGSLDSKNGEQIMKLLVDFQKQNESTLIVVTHDNEIALQMSRRLFVKDGKIFS